MKYILLKLEQTFLYIYKDIRKISTFPQDYFFIMISKSPFHIRIGIKLCIYLFYIYCTFYFLKPFHKISINETNKIIQKWKVSKLLPFQKFIQLLSVFSLLNLLNDSNT